MIVILQIFANIQILQHARISSFRLFHMIYDLRGSYDEIALSDPCFKKGRVIRRVVAKLILYFWGF